MHSSSLVCGGRLSRNIRDVDDLNPGLKVTLLTIRPV